MAQPAPRTRNTRGKGAERAAFGSRKEGGKSYAYQETGGEQLRWGGRCGVGAVHARCLLVACLTHCPCIPVASRRHSTSIQEASPLYGPSIPVASLLHARPFKSVFVSLLPVTVKVTGMLLVCVRHAIGMPRVCVEDARHHHLHLHLNIQRHKIGMG